MKGPGRAVGLSLLLAGTLAALLGGRSARGAGDDDAPYRAQIPAWWREAPELVPDEAELEGLELVSRRGFADPAGGCFALVQVVDAPKKAGPPSVHRAFRESLEKAGIAISAAGEESDEGPLALHLEFGTMRGEVRVFTARREGGGLRAASAACFYNQREPTVSEKLCLDMLDSFEVMP